jgi:hypothetical protein
MNLFELIFFLILVAAVMLGSRAPGNLTGIPEPAAAFAIVGLVSLMVRAFTRISPRAILQLSASLLMVSLLSFVLANIVNLHNSILVIPVAVGLIFILLRKVFLRRRGRLSDSNTGL